MRLASADAPNATGEVQQGADVQGAAKEPSKDSAAAASEPEAAGEIRPTRTGEQIGGWVVDRDIRHRDVGLLTGLVVEQEQQREDVHGSDRSQQTSGCRKLAVAQGPADREGPVEQVAKGSTSLQAAEVG